jgi:hypothetical protein
LVDFFKSSPLKLLDQMNRNLIGSIYARSSIKIAHFVFQFIWSSGFRGEDFFKSTNQKQELPVVTLFVNETGR